MLKGLSETRALWIAFGATVLITLSFPIASSIAGIAFVDALSDPNEVRQAIAAMSVDQRIFHAWVTATLDVAYPIAYCALFIGSAYRFFPRYGRFIAMPLVVLLATDLLEGLVQVLALTESADFIDAKALLTPLKFALFLAGFVTMVLGWIVWLIARLRRD